MKPDYSPRAIKYGLIGTALIVVIVLVTFNYRAIPFWPGTAVVVAEFGDTGALSVGDKVQIAGIEAGDVRSIDLADDHVDVKLRITSGWQDLGSEPRASIKVETALGKRFVQLDAGPGPGELPDRIPMSRTSSGFDLTESLEQVTTLVGNTDKAQAVDAVDSLTEVMRGLPDELSDSLTDLAGAAQTVASRDSDIRTLLSRAASVTEILAARDDKLTAMIGDGAVLFDHLNDRSELVRSVLVELRRVSNEINALITSTKAQTPPMLAELNAVIATLTANYDNINQSISGLETYVTQLGEVVGSGPFFSVLLHNILPANLRGQQPGSPGGGR